MEQKMKNQKYIKQIAIIISLFSLVIGCSNTDKNIKDIYIAEKMFFKAGKIQRNISINPDIASPEEYTKSEHAYRDIIAKFGPKSSEIQEIKAIVRLYSSKRNGT